ncbi:gamma subclass chorismate mutase AroQ [Nocardia seriolae]|nr:gamma subclass chorismate mutase AroQ [Nocardia seriolae]QOW30966.1 gamma subclass chorismate mutase AroQ [Nocardia seriolae]QUN15100.1 gamma subclass chorismate mutase AroQ [Nocardia seriolae]WKY51216.1 gamma subclass chorismate mutase AroQ [Nocardia seriolae]WNJ57906.1 gamma subclass chorismate mutase AroQ [Nocardia seriolae]
MLLVGYSIQSTHGLLLILKGCVQERLRQEGDTRRRGKSRGDDEVKGVVLAAVSSLMLLGGQAAGAGAAQAEQPGSLDRLVGFVADRLQTADAVAAAKWASAVEDGSQPAIDDPVREAQVYDSMARLGAEKGLPADWVRQVFAGQIEANKIVQRGLVTEWRSGLVSPASAADLSAVRSVIDRANVEIIDELASERDELAKADCAGRLADSMLVTVRARHGDALHQAALVRAVLPLCEK